MSRIPKITNPDLIRSIQKVHDAKDRENAAKLAYSIIVKKYQGHRFFTYLFIWRAFETNPDTLWERSGFLHCTQQNYLLYVLLLKSGWYSDEDIQLGYSLVWYVSPHQYLRISGENGVLALDPWNNAFGAPYGSYSSGFGHNLL